MKKKNWVVYNKWMKKNVGEPIESKADAIRLADGLNAQAGAKEKEPCYVVVPYIERKSQ